MKPPSPSGKRSSARWWDRVLCAGWGFAEATLFFIVPDVPLSFLVLERPRRAWIGCAWVIAGAMAGGAVMLDWGARDPAGA